MDGDGDHVLVTTVIHTYIHIYYIYMPYTWYDTCHMILWYDDTYIYRYSDMMICYYIYIIWRYMMILYDMMMILLYSSHDMPYHMSWGLYFSYFFLFPLDIEFTYRFPSDDIAADALMRATLAPGCLLFSLIMLRATASLFSCRHGLILRRRRHAGQALTRVTPFLVFTVPQSSLLLFAFWLPIFRDIVMPRHSPCNTYSMNLFGFRYISLILFLI